MKNYIGLTLEEAIEKATKDNLRWRVVKENGERFFITQELATNRINFDVEDNIITNAEIY